LPGFQFVANIGKLSAIGRGVLIARWQIHGPTDDVDQSKLPVSIRQWNRPDKPVRRSVIGQKWFAATLIRLEVNSRTFLDPIEVKPVCSSRASGKIVSSMLER
jgi:hypothetical protein